MQVQSKLRNFGTSDTESVNMLAREILEMKSSTALTGYGGMVSAFRSNTVFLLDASPNSLLYLQCTTNFDCTFALFPSASMQCCTDGKDLNTCHFFCNSMIHASNVANPKNANQGVTLATIGQNNNAEGVILATIGQNNAVNGNTLAEIGQGNTVNGIAIAEEKKMENVDSIYGTNYGVTFSMNYYYQPPPMISGGSGKYEYNYK